MPRWLRKLIVTFKKISKKIKKSDFYGKIEKRIEDESSKHISLKQKILWVLLLLFSIDLTLYLSSVISSYDREESELQKLSKNIEEMNYYDKNSSSLKALLKSDKVFFVVDEQLNVDIFLQEGNVTKEIKNLPIYSITRNIEKELIKANINYEWLKEEDNRPKFLIMEFMEEHILDILLIGLILFMLQSSGMMLNGDKFRVYRPKEIKGSMDDIIGYEDIKEEVQHLVDMLKNLSLYSKYGIEDIFNIMFSGQQGTGKTTMAVQIAKKLKVPILVTTGNIETGFVGGGAKVIKSIYAKANALAEDNEFKTCIVFIDEAQNLLMKRGQSREKWADDTPNELLTHLEGVKSIHDVRIITIVASNFDESNMQLDEAMSARFKKKIHFRLPNEEEREALLKHFLEKVENREESIDLQRLARAFSMTSPRTLQTIVQESALLAIAKDKNVSEEDLMKAFEVVMIGKSDRKTSQNREREREIISIHEIGHFMADFKQTMADNAQDFQKTKEQMRVIKISSESISRANALGYVLNQSDDILLHSIEALEKEVRILYGGVASEELIFGKRNITTGSANDIEKITRILHHLFIETSAYSEAKLKLDTLDSLKEVAYREMESKSITLYRESLDLLRDEKKLIEYLANILMERWVISKEEIFEEIEAFRKREMS